MTHVCSPCGQQFATEAEYIGHMCPKTQHTPADIDHQNVLTNGRFSKIAEAAIKRGAERAQ